MDRANKMGHLSTPYLAKFCVIWLLILVAFCSCIINIDAHLYTNFYARRCPKLESIVRNVMIQEVGKNPNMAAAVLRLFYHDCFVNGCDASVLLDDTPSFTGEKNAIGNQNSLRGFELIDTIKHNVEAYCHGTVSCADILTIAARDAVQLVGGPMWTVRLGRRDTRTTTQRAANENLPPATANLAALIALFNSKNLTARDMTALSGAHTIGQARCSSYRTRIYNDANIDYQFATTSKYTCPVVGGDNNLVPLDMGTPYQFDNSFFINLMAKRGLLHSDQELFNGGSQDSWVRLYAKSNYALGKDFAVAMIKLGNITPLVGGNGEIRRNCRFVN